MLKIRAGIIIILILVLSPLNVNAQRGCCSHHGGVSGCSSTGRQICNDGTLSPSCTCVPVVADVYGCTDKNAKNYDSRANKDDGSCIDYIYGCTDEDAENYNEEAEKDDGSCTYYVYGCTDEMAENYNSSANKDDGGCIYKELDNNISNYTEEDTKNNEGNFVDVLGTIGIFTSGYYFIKLRKRKK